MGILDGKNILVAGVTMHTSIGYKVAELAQQEGATVIVSNFGRAMSLTGRVIKRLDPVPALIELDVTDDEHLAGLADTLREHVDHLDGVVHSIAFANPETALGGRFLQTSWPDVGQAVHVSAYSLVALAMACRPLLGRGSSIVGMTFDATVSWPFYDWMGVAKAALESANRYLARYLGPDGVRSNLISAGPIDTLAKKAIPGTEEFNRVWGERAPLGWSTTDSVPAAKGVLSLLSDYFPATTGEIIHVDGGLHATGS
ncbi:enoyl-ACP reductase FabI [Propionicicella superfundia]|uniref:enoyl-ACP reductase FabI n=1 Tax=Propionicicella superfundia TaxID=348582 RepID=UPI0004002A8D|nr:enoyl-ACP reductase FabI [Propionicicella superfundia]